MIIEQGVYNDKEYTAVRIWLGPKRKLDGTLNKPYRRTFGPWNNANIQRANIHVKEIRANYLKGIMPGQEPQTLSFPMACDIYEKRWWVDKASRSSKGVKNIKYTIDRFRQTWRARVFNSILPSDIDAYVLDRKAAGVVDSTINKELAILSSLFGKIHHWVNRREIGPYILPMTLQGEVYNPVSYVERASTIASKRERVATDAELVMVKVYCDTHDPDMLIIITRNILTGLRKSDLEKVNGLSDVRGVLSKSREKKLFKFPLDFSQKIKYKNYARRWNDLRKACDMLEGEKRFVWHDWRHTSATMLAENGFTDEQIQEFLGHSSRAQTRDYINRGKERVRPQVQGLQSHLAKLWKDVQPPVPQDPTKKVCLGCKELKPLTDFGKHAYGKGGLNAQCKVCNYARLKRLRSLNPNIRAKEYSQRSMASNANRGVGKSVGNDASAQHTVNVS